MGVQAPHGWWRAVLAVRMPSGLSYPATGLVHYLETDTHMEGQVIEHRPNVAPRHRMGIH
jgi:hypothetical protein